VKIGNQRVGPGGRVKTKTPLLRIFLFYTILL
jgi:hypothetical protein